MEKLLCEKDNLIVALTNENQQLREKLELSSKQNQELNEDFQYTTNQLAASEAICLNSIGLPQRLASEVVLRAKRHVNSANKINFTILKDYTHKGFLSKEIEEEGHQNELLQLLDGVLEAIDATKVRHQQSAEEARVSETKSLKAKAAVLATLMDYANPDFIWDYATIEAVLIKSHSPSRLVLDLVSSIVPGQSSGQSLERHLEAFAKTGLERGNAGLYQGSYLIYVYDNAPCKGGYVFRPSAEVTKK